MKAIADVLCDALREAGRDDAAEVVRLVVERDDLARWLRTEAAYSTPGQDYDESYGCPECRAYAEHAHNNGCARADFLRALVPGWADVEAAEAHREAIAEDRYRRARAEAARREAEREAREPLVRQAREASDRLARQVAADLFGVRIEGAWLNEGRPMTATEATTLERNGYPFTPPPPPLPRKDKP